MGERYLVYLVAWAVADVLAYFARFDVVIPGHSLLPLVAVQAASLIGLLIWKAGRRVGVGDLIAVAFVGTLAFVAVSVWSQGEMSRLFLALQFIFSIGTLLVAHVALGWTTERR